MADPSFHTRLEHVCLRADGTQQAVAHFTHDSFGTSLLTLVFAGAQVDLRSADQSIRFPRDVRVKAFEFISCRIPYDHMVACETGAGGSGTNLSWPASAYCS